MAKTALNSAETVLVIGVVAVPVHYFAGLEWPWAIAVGAAASIALRWLVNRVGAPASSKATAGRRPLSSLD